MNPPRLVSLLLVAGFLFVPELVGARAIQGSSEDPSADVRQLRALIEETLAAARAQDAAGLAALIDNLRLPNHPDWFARAFGHEEGARQAAKYARFLEQFQPILEQRFAALATQTGLEAEVSRISLSPDSVESVEELPRARAPLALFAVTLRKPGTEFAPRLAWFVHQAGAFRFVGRMRASTAPPLQIRIAEAVQQRKLLSRPAPAYPVYLRETNLQGEVRLETLIDTNGRVKELRVLSGHPMLVAAAVEGVQKWRYQPTLLDGEPAEVVTLVTVVFRLDQ